MSTKLQAIRDEACNKLCDLFTEALPDMEDAIQEAVTEAQANETEAKFKVGFSVTYNLDKNKVGYQLGFSIKRSWDSESEVPDPNQGRLPLEGVGAVTISTPGLEPVTVTEASLRETARKMRGRGKEGGK